jgi:hypothetical protein
MSIELMDEARKLFDEAIEPLEVTKVVKHDPLTMTIMGVWAAATLVPYALALPFLHRVRKKQQAYNPPNPMRDLLIGGPEFFANRIRCGTDDYLRVNNQEAFEENGNAVIFPIESWYDTTPDRFSRFGVYIPNATMIVGYNKPSEKTFEMGCPELLTEERTKTIVGTGEYRFHVDEGLAKRINEVTAELDRNYKEKLREGFSDFLKEEPGYINT